MSKTRTSHSEGGFTILELLIATVVFSMILILITTGILRFTRQYYKGVIQNQTQDAARGIMDDITRAIQYNGGGGVAWISPPSSSGGSFCVGQTKRYRYYLNSQVSSAANSAQHQTLHALVSDSVAGCNSSTPTANVMNTDPLPGANPRELIGSHMRLSNLSISGAGNVWTITVRVVYGDDELLCSPSIPGALQGGCQYAGGSIGNTLNGRTDVTCKGETGSQFCAVSELTTTVDKRVQ